MTDREKALEACAAEICVSVATNDDGDIDYREMYLRWRAIACERADIARAALAMPATVDGADFLRGWPDGFECRIELRAKWSTKHCCWIVNDGDGFQQMIRKNAPVSLSADTPTTTTGGRPMTSEDIRKLLEAATPGPWTEHEKGVHPYPYVCGATQEYEHGPDQPVVTYLVGMNLKGNQALIAAAPDLAAEVLRLRDELASGSFYKESDIDAMQDEIARLRGVAISTAASLAAAISLLERGGKAAKKAAPSDKMFDQMLTDYRNSLDAARAALGDSDG